MENEGTKLVQNLSKFKKPYKQIDFSLKLILLIP